MNFDKVCFLVEKGIIDYAEALSLQKKLFQAKKEGKLKEDVLFLLEHPPTITIGKKGSMEEILVDEKILQKKKVLVYKIGRGGKSTYHGPGQLVGYPILNLANYGKDIHLYLRYLEEVIIRTLNDFNIKAQRIKGLTGVWVGNKKIASIGVEVKKWISLHGFALNVSTELDYFNLIKPCGLKAEIMTSMSQILGTNIKVQDVSTFPYLSLHFRECC